MTYGTALLCQHVARLISQQKIDADGRTNGDAPTPLSNSPQTDLFAVLTHWVEDGVAPERGTATRYVDNTPAKGIALQRPLCPYPQKAWYKGSGDTRAATSCTCSTAPSADQR